MIIATAWALGAVAGLIGGFYLAAMLLFRDPIVPEDPYSEPHGDVPGEAGR
jgi:hypothetical protein